MLKKHLLDGVKKGALTEAQVEQKFSKWLQEKDGKIVAKKDNLAGDATKKKSAQSKAETASKEAKAAKIAAKVAPVVETETPVVETPEAAAEDTTTNENPA